MKYSYLETRHKLQKMSYDNMFLFHNTLYSFIQAITSSFKYANDDNIYPYNTFIELVYLAF